MLRLLEPPQQAQAPASHGVILLGRQPDVGQARLLDGEAVAVGPGVVLGACHDVEDGGPAGRPSPRGRGGGGFSRLGARFRRRGVVVVVAATPIRPEPADGAPLVQSVQPEADCVGQLRIIRAAAVIVGGAMAVAAAGIADEGHHGVEEVARVGWAAAKRNVGTGTAATATGTGADMRWDRQERFSARARTCAATSTSGGSARILVGGRRQHDGKINILQFAAAPIQQYLWRGILFVHARVADLG